LEALGVPLLTTRICERKAYRRALTQGQAVAEFEPSSKAAHEIATLWKEIQAVPVKQKRLNRKKGTAV
jgi:chromosome partitioning protein